jgi:hypothetical protein
MNGTNEILSTISSSLVDAPDGIKLEQNRRLTLKFLIRSTDDQDEFSAYMERLVGRTTTR